MNYYERHLGDYAKDTAHLTMIEHGAYGLLLDRYYATEQPIPANQAHRVARARTDEERTAVDVVLEEFFELVEEHWVNHRAEEEIAKAQARIKAAKENGKRGGRPKNPTGSKPKTEEKPSGFSVGLENETQDKALHVPVSSIKTIPPDRARGEMSTIPRDFEVTDEHREFAKVHRLPNPDDCILTFCAHHESKATLSANWDAEFRKWLGKQKAFNAMGTKNVNGARAGPRRSQHDDRMAVFQQLNGQDDGRDSETERVIDGEAERVG